jgi:hypothetical protein
MAITCSNFYTQNRPATRSFVSVPLTWVINTLISAVFISFFSAASVARATVLSILPSLSTLYSDAGKPSSVSFP